MRRLSSVMTCGSIAMIGAISRSMTLAASGMTRFGRCARSSPEALNEVSRKTTRVMRKSMKGTSAIATSTPFRPPPATRSWTNFSGIW